ncbi:hypothetical protein QUF64_05225 [Anaerolineales bacterium HSG6]|nr:hypothetical protein [Anaerolineales bacterium HSG6]
MTQLYTRYNKPITLDEQIGRGGEAIVYAIAEKKILVAKVYHQPAPQQEAKLKAMLAYPPQQPSDHVAIVWPRDLLYQQDGQFAGFLMLNLRADLVMQSSESIVNFYNPSQRVSRYSAFNWQYLHRTALNLMIAADGVHGQGHVIGDVNESNILVSSQALVTLIDTDSFQINDHVGNLYRCPVGKPEYTPPELQGVSFREVDQLPAHDNFGLAVLIFQLLMEGYHPFTGRLISEESVGRVDLHGIRKGLFPYLPNNVITPPPNAPKFEILHPALQSMFLHCFVEGHSAPSVRPSPRAWINALEEAEAALIVCNHDENHVYSNHVDGCPWCATQPMTQRALPSAQSSSGSGSKPTSAIANFVEQTNAIQQAVEQKKASIQPQTANLPAFRPDGHPQDNIKVTLDEQGLTIVYKETWGCALSLMVLSLISLVSLGVAYTQMTSIWVWLIFCSPGWLVAGGLLWWMLKQLFNRIVFTVDSGKLHREQKPLRRSIRQFKVAEIQHLYTKCRHRQNSKKFQLYIVKRNGQHSEVWEHSNYNTVRYIELEIKQYLNIPDVPIEGEYIPDEEKKGKYSVNSPEKTSET